MIFIWKCFHLFWLVRTSAVRMSKFLQSQVFLLLLFITLSIQNISVVNTWMTLEFSSPLLLPFSISKPFTLPSFLYIILLIFFFFFSAFLTSHLSPTRHSRCFLSGCYVAVKTLLQHSLFWLTSLSWHPKPSSSPASSSFCSSFLSHNEKLSFQIKFEWKKKGNGRILRQDEELNFFNFILSLRFH